MTPVNPKVLDTLNWGISSEIKSYVFYIEAAKRAPDDTSREALTKLAAEEKEHYQVLERQHHALINSEQWVTYNDILSQDGLPEISEEMSDRHRELIQKVKSAESHRAILEMALDLEKEAHDVFSAAAERAEDEEEKKTFVFLARFEMGHVKIIQGMIDQL